MGSFDRRGHRLTFPPPRGRRLARSLPLLSLLLIGLLAAYAEGQRRVDRPNAAEAERAISELRSPYCPGLMLETCPSPPAAALRDSLFDLAAEGLSAPEIVEWMLARHGEEWRAVPQRSGAGLWAWVMPPLAILIGVGAVIGWLRANRREEQLVSEVSTPSDISDTEREELAVALRRWEESGEDLS
jgi:cytochrome c-type biogenesis protein CcmH